MGHLRSFIENLQKAAVPAVHAKVGGAMPDSKWGAGLLYFRQHNILTKAEEAFVSSLYTLISDEAIHPLVAEPKYARLFRNVVIEYALLLLWKLKELGVKL
jgi:hypothetical protein